MDERHILDVTTIEKTCFSKPWSEASIEQEFKNENAHFLVAIDHQKTIGYIGILVAAGECSVTNIAVMPEKRCQGIGTKLLDKALREARLRQDEFMTLEVRESNTTAIKLYEKFGFERVGQRKDYYDDPTEDALLLTKYLTAKGKKDEDTGN
ncbi:Mycothiol acetyltransferase [bioreactor metagenome]|uniref:Mycothiol acetyltransferase n=1 Tax=bioreactor metagenome TaxID=1076179 RepID=A0A645GIA3_9ZZZZ